MELNEKEITSIDFQSIAIDNSYYSGKQTFYFPNIEVIEDFAFDYVTKIKSVRLGSKVISIGANVGRSTCVNGFYLEATTPPTLTGALKGGQVWYVPRSAQYAYEAAPYWSELNAQGKLKYIEEL